MITEQLEADLLHLLRTTAKTEILPRYRALERGDIASKSSASDLVTIADRMSEKAISTVLASLLPDAEIVGEEAVAEDPDVLKRIQDADLSVIVDPIDGTWNFAKGVPLFGVILAVVCRSETVFGALYDPVMDDVTIAHKGRGAHHISRNGTRRRLHLPATDQTDLSRLVGGVPLFVLPHERKRKAAAKLAAFERVVSYRCACHDYRILAEGSLDFSISAKLNVWDHAAGEMIYREAGGYAAMMANEEPYSPEMTSGYLLVARSKDMWRMIRDELKDGFV